MSKSERIESPSVLLLGLPNVGKSALFNQLTGLSVSVANYAGTTVEFSRGYVELKSAPVGLIDVPGTYTLDASNAAEEVAIGLLEQHHGPVVCVLDANNLEASMYLLLQILDYRLPTMAVLNRLDLAQRWGNRIDAEMLEQVLGIKVVPTVATEGQGLTDLKDRIGEMLTKPQDFVVDHAPAQSATARWKQAEDLVKRVSHRRHLQTRERTWGLTLVKPFPGLLFAAVILALVFAFVIGAGMSMRQFLLLPLFRGAVLPMITAVVSAWVPEGVVQNILIGEYGFLIKGIEWPFTLVLPYVLSFYVALAVLEDSGYLPRLAILLDGVFGRMGLAGSSVIPLFLGYGCGIPGILATRSLSSRKERLMISALICLAVPCISQTGAFISLLAARSIGALAAVYAVSLVAMFAGGLILDRMLPGALPATLIELPALLPPKVSIVSKKVLGRLRCYVFDGALPMMAAIGLAAVLYESGVMAWWGQLMQPLVSGWLRLPEEAAVPLALGILRRELTVLPLIDMNVTSLQLFTGAIVGLFYVPCIAMVGTLGREFGLYTAVAVLMVTTAVAFLSGGVLARVGALFL